MTYTIKLTSDARDDINDATQQYNITKNNLGSELFTAIAEVVDLLQDNPFLFQKKYRDIRHAPVARFNFAIHFFIEDKTVIIIAVLHNSRNPQIWKDR